MHTSLTNQTNAHPSATPIGGMGAFMITIQINTRKFTCPTSWAECTRSQAEALGLFIGRNITPLSPRHMQEAIVFTWLRCEQKYWQKLQLTPEQFIFMLEKLAWVNTAPAVLPFEHIEIGNVKYWLPEPHYKTATAIEIAWLNVAWLQFTAAAKQPPLSTGEGAGGEVSLADAALNELLAIALRPRRANLAECYANHLWNGDSRIPLSEHGVNLAKPTIATLSDATKNLILRYIEATNNAFIDEFKVLFGNPSEGEPATQDPTYPDGFGWEAALRRIAQEGTFGTYEKVCQTNGRQIWMYEYQKYLEAKQQAEAQQRANDAAKKK